MRGEYEEERRKVVNERVKGAGRQFCKERIGGDDDDVEREGWCWKKREREGSESYVR